MDSPSERIERVLLAIADEVRESPRLQVKLLDLLKIPVQLQGSDAVPFVDTVLLVNKGFEEFRGTLGTFTVSELKKIIKLNDLWSGDLPRTKGAMIDLMWRASEERRKIYPSS